MLKNFKVWHIGLLICLFVAGCGPMNLLVPKAYTTPLSPSKPVIYVATFEDLRQYSEVGIEYDFFYFCCLVPIKLHARNNIGELASIVFVDELRKQNINAVFYGTRNPLMNKDDIIIKGQVTDFLAISPPFFPIQSFKVRLGMKISVVDFNEETLMAEEFKEKYGSRTDPQMKTDFKRRNPFAVLLDLRLRSLCEEIINEKVFQKYMEE